MKPEEQRQMIKSALSAFAYRLQLKIAFDKRREGIKLRLPSPENRDDLASLNTWVSETEASQGTRLNFELF